MVPSVTWAALKLVRAAPSLTASVVRGPMVTRDASEALSAPSSDWYWVVSGS